MDLSNVDLLKLQTRTMQSDPSVKGFTSALNNQLKDIALSIGDVLIFSQIDRLPDEVLDILAWQFNVDWYDAENDIQVKREAIKEAIIVQQLKGTPAAVQRVVEIYFGDGKVEEWFKYGGQPYHFRIVTNNPSANQERAALLTRAVNSVKRLSTVLETVIIESTESMDLSMGFALHMGDIITLEQEV